MEQFRTEVIDESGPDSGPEESSRGGVLQFLADILETLLLSLVLFLAINAISARIRVDGFSMEPTLHTGEFVIVNKLAYLLGQPQPGDVVVFHFPGNPEQEYIKRVIGLPGDQVKVMEGRVYVNDRLLDEPYIKSPPAYNDEWLVPDDQLFVLGDNRNNSSDSHNWGGVPLDYVVGKAVFIYWPPAEWGLVSPPIPVMAAP